MIKKEKELLTLLQATDHWVPAKELAHRLHVSLRTIHNYLNTLKNYGYVIESSSQGIRLQKKLEGDDLCDEYFPNSPEERTQYLIMILLKHTYSKNEPLCLYDLCDELYISESTAHLDIQKAKREFTKHKLTLRFEQDQIWLEGNEIDRRKMISEILYTESSDHFMNLKTMEIHFPNLPISELASKISNILYQHQYFINDYAFMNLILHIMIAIDRIQTGFLSFPMKSSCSLSLEYGNITEEIANCIKDSLHIEFDEYEKEQIAFLLHVRTTKFNSQELSLNELKQAVGEVYVDFTKNVLDKVSDYYLIELNDEPFYIRLALHIYNLVLRSQMHYENRNPLLNTLKLNCPMIYEVSIYISRKIQETFHIKMSEGEIAFITMHIGGEIENKKILKQKSNAIYISRSIMGCLLNMSIVLNSNLEISVQYSAFCIL